MTNSIENPENTIIVHQERGIVQKATRFVGWATIGVTLGLTAAASIWEALDRRSEKVEFDGASTLVHIGDQASFSIAPDVGMTAGGNAKHDTLLTPDSRAYNMGQFVQDVVYNPQGLFKLESFDDEDIGFHVLMTVFDGENDSEFDYTQVDLLTLEPTSCKASPNNNVSPGEIELDEDCIRTINAIGIWEGVRHSTFGKGGVYGTRLDNTPPTKARIMTDEMLDNTWCQLGLRFGVGADLVIWDDVDDSFKIKRSNASWKSVFDGVRNQIIAIYRKEAAEMTGLPLTKSNGAFIFLTPSQRDFYKQVAQAYGPLDEMSAEEFERNIQTELFKQGGRIVPDNSIGEIPYDVSTGRKLLDLQRDDPSIVPTDYSKNDDWASENGDPDLFFGNYNCLPLESERLGLLREEIIMATRLGGLSGLGAGVQLIKDPTVTELETKLDNILINPGGRNLLTGYIKHNQTKEVVDAKIAVHMRNVGLELSEYQVALLARLEGQSNE